MSLSECGFFGRGTNCISLAPEDSTMVAASDELLRFDSGRAITNNAGTRSLAIFGGTGSGKTGSLILPSVCNVVRNGLGGIIIDVKGNLREQVRAIVDHYGRTSDLVEFGSSNEANRTNLLDGFENHEAANLFMQMATDGAGDMHNLSFHEHGGRIYRDVYQCLKLISNISRNCSFSKQFRPTLKKIYEIANNINLSSTIWNYFEKELDTNTEKYIKKGEQLPEYLMEAEKLRSIVNSDNFHSLKKEFPTNPINHNFWDQRSYALGRINRAFSSIEETYGLLDKFSCTDKDAVQLDFNKLIYKDNKIVLIHFAIDCGYAADLLSKIIKKLFYESVIKNGLQ
ncbi:MAG: hypothetical protein IJT42_02380, partial [Treponema sp.]|nr:hypothetical protein [Treponema sp.]